MYTDIPHLREKNIKLRKEWNRVFGKEERSLIPHLWEENIKFREEWNRVFGREELSVSDQDCIARLKDFKENVTAFLDELIKESGTVRLKLDYYWITQTVFSWKIFLKTYFLDFSERPVPPSPYLMDEDGCESCYYSISVQQERAEQPHIHDIDFSKIKPTSVIYHICDLVNNRYYRIPEGICIEDIVRLSIIRIPGTGGTFAVIALAFKEEGGIKSGKHYYYPTADINK